MYSSNESTYLKCRVGIHGGTWTDVDPLPLMTFCRADTTSVHNQMTLKHSTGTGVLSPSVPRGTLYTVSRPVASGPGYYVVRLSSSSSSLAFFSLLFFFLPLLSLLPKLHLICQPSQQLIGPSHDRPTRWFSVLYGPKAKVQVYPLSRVHTLFTQYYVLRLCSYFLARNTEG